MQTLRKKNSPCKYKKEPTRFLGEGVSFKAKLIGILEVSEARGDRMCQAALADLKMAIRAAGEHKQRIAVQVSIDGLRLRDEKSGECLYHHPVHKISFIAQDMSDSRAFGYIFGSPDTGHRFFGIKTDKAANQVVIAMRDLFQVVFELKKKEIELAKHHIEQNNSKYHTHSIFVEPAPDTKGAAGAEGCVHRLKSLSSENEKTSDKNSDNHEGVMADLLDLQFELNSIQQGINEMEKITPEISQISTDDPFEPDPFGDSFINMKVKDAAHPILPPPPSSSKRGHLDRMQSLSTQPQIKMNTIVTAKNRTSPLQTSQHWLDNNPDKHYSDDEMENSSSISTAQHKDATKNDNDSPYSRIQESNSQIDVFTELDPLGTGLSKPYVDKKDFFQHLKNPPKRVLKDLVTTTSNDLFTTQFNTFTYDKVADSEVKPKHFRESDNFADFDTFEVSQICSSAQSNTSESHESPHVILPLSVSLPPEECSILKWIAQKGIDEFSETSDSIFNPTKPSSPINRPTSDKKHCNFSSSDNFKTSLTDKFSTNDFQTTNESPASPLRSCSSEANSRLSSSSAELDIIPEPPPRSISNDIIDPPPLPPKKLSTKENSKPPPRPPHNDSHYDFTRNDKASCTSNKNNETSEIKNANTDNNFHENFTSLQEKNDGVNSSASSTFEKDFNKITPSILTSIVNTSFENVDKTKIDTVLSQTLNQLASSNLAELAASLNMNVSQLTNLTFQQLTEYFLKSKFENPQITRQDSHSLKFKEMSNKFENSDPILDQSVPGTSNFDKYAVFRELLEVGDVKKESAFRYSAAAKSIDQEDTKVDTIGENEEAMKPNIDSDRVLNNEGNKMETNDSEEIKETIIILDNNKSGNEIEDEKNNKFEESDKTEYSLRESEDPKDTDPKREAKKLQSPPSSSVSTDKYAALRDIIIENKSPEKPPTDECTLVPSTETVKSLIDQDLMKLFSAPQSENSSPTKSNQDNTSSQAFPTDIFEEIKMLTNRGTDPEVSNKESDKFLNTLCPLPTSKRSAKEPKNSHNWAKFDIDIAHSNYLWYENPSIIKGTSPWSPDEKDVYDEPAYKICTSRHSGESDNEWKDEEESEESNGVIRDTRFRSGKHSRFNSECGKVIHYDNIPRVNDPGRHFRERTNKDMCNIPWDKCNYRSRIDLSPRHDSERWEDRQRLYVSRKNFYEDDEFMGIRKCRNSQRVPWIEERDLYRLHEHSMYDNDGNKRRIHVWNEDERDRDRFSSQESMSYNDDDRWSKKEYERKRRDDAGGRFWDERHGIMTDTNYSMIYRKHNPHYHRSERDHMSYDYSPSCEKDHFNRFEGSRKCNIRKRNWPKRPNSANDNRHTDIIYTESRMKYGISKSECSDNDSEHYHPYRSKSRESYWDSDHEFDNWGEKYYWSGESDSKSDIMRSKRMSRCKPAETSSRPKNSCFEDDFTLHSEQNHQMSVQPSMSLKIHPDNRKKLQLFNPQHDTSENVNNCYEKHTEQSKYVENDHDRDPHIPSKKLSIQSSQDSGMEINSKNFECIIKESPPVAESPPVVEDIRNITSNSDLKLNDDEFKPKSEIDNDPNIGSIRKTTLSLKSNNNKIKENSNIKKSESVNIFVRENDPFDDDDFFK